MTLRVGHPKGGCRQAREMLNDLALRQDLRNDDHDDCDEAVVSYIFIVYCHIHLF